VARTRGRKIERATGILSSLPLLALLLLYLSFVTAEVDEGECFVKGSVRTDEC
jgi:hypothetical protein